MALFKKAAPIVAAPKAGKKEKAVHAIEGLESYAQIDAAIKALEALKGSFEPAVKGAAFNTMLATCGSRAPESFTGVDGAATASMEFRKRGTNSALKEEEVALLLANGVTPFEQEICPELFAINPKYAADDKLLEKVEAALSGIVPEDFIVQQAKISKMVVTDDNVDAVFALRPKLADDAQFGALVKTVITQAVKAKLAKTDFDEIMAAVAVLCKKSEASDVEEA